MTYVAIGADGGTGCQPVVPAATRRLVLRALFVVVAIGGGAAVWRSGQVSTIRSALATLRHLDPGSAALIGVVLLVHRGLGALVARTALRERVGLGRTFMAGEASAAVSNCGLGGASFGTGLRFAMLRSWGVAPIDISVAITVAAVTSTLAGWVLAFAVTAPTVLARQANGTEIAVAVVSTLVLVISALMIWKVALHSDTRRAAIIGERLHGWFERHWPRAACFLRRRGFAGGEVAVAFSTGVRELARGRGHRLAFTALQSQLVLALLFVVCVDGVASRRLPVMAMVQAFAMIRMAGSVTPLPGGLGIVDVGLVASLRRVGLSAEESIASVTMFRALTFGLPFVTGPLCAAWWWRSRRRSA